MDGLSQYPFLRAGTGKTPAEGGCIMQIVDWISTGGWTDKPLCVWEPLRGYAIAANDLATDVNRQRLLDLIPRLMGTASRAYALPWRSQEQVEFDLRVVWCGVRGNVVDDLIAVLDAFDERVPGAPQATELPDLSALCELMPARA